MKHFLLLSLPAILLAKVLSMTAPPPFFSNTVIADSNGIRHELDGYTTEWPNEKFENDKETGISYALDNDSANFFVAMRVPAIPEQVKIMRMGMRFFIDLKAKKKENMGIEFPIKRKMPENSGGFSSGNRPTENDQNGDGRRQFDPKAMRARMATNLIFMKIFGFENEDESQKRTLMVDGSANIAFAWDSLDVMYIEYRIPLSMIGGTASLQNKAITAGWKINGFDMPSPGGGTGTGDMNSRNFSAGRLSRGYGRNSGSGSTNNGADNTSSQGNFENMMKEQSIWTKYTFILPTASKGF